MSCVWVFVFALLLLVSKPGSSIKKKLNLGGDKFVIPARRPRGEVDLEFREMVWAGDKYLGAVSLILIF